MSRALAVIPRLLCNSRAIAAATAPGGAHDFADHPRPLDGSPQFRLGAVFEPSPVLPRPPEHTLSREELERLYGRDYVLYEHSHHH